MASIVELTDPAGLLGGIRWADTYAQALFDGADELGQIEQFNVTSRTPILTGALASDVSYSVGPRSDNVIVQIYSGTANQTEEYGRVYDIHQEGGSLGAGSNNGSGNHQMYAQIMTTDIPAIQEWGQKALQGACDAVASGRALR